ncbi:hypothetical protein [Streptomyces zhihengii]|uniref:hypothetical protein n=1 Tax=Streptomyces zhihengii TaxID=1818004 RepID=UPI0033B6A7FE
MSVSHRPGMHDAHRSHPNQGPAPCRSLDEHLAEFDSLFAGLLTWLPRLYDPETGGFYYALSSRTTPRFEPDIESTCMAIRILAQFDLLESLPPSVRDHLIRFLQGRQDTATGFFLDGHNEMGTIERMRGRALSAATDALKMLESRPLHPLPGSAGAGSDHLKHLMSPRAFEVWLEGRPWENSWLAQDNIQAQGALIKLLPPEQQAERVGQALRFVTERQDPVTGFAGGGSPYVRLSGAFKLALFCRAFDRAVPRAENIYAATMECLRTEFCEDACWLRNPLELIEVLRPQLGPRPQAELDEVVRISARNARHFSQPDGGFSRKPGSSSPAPNDVPLGLGLAEGDLNASVQLAVIARPTLYRFANIGAPQLPGSDECRRAFARS